MKVFVLVALLLTYSTIGSYALDRHLVGRSLHGKSASASASSSSSSSSSSGGSSSSSAAASSTGGVATATSVASSKALVKVKNDLIEFFKAVFAFSISDFGPADKEDKYCSDALAIIDEQLKAVGSAIAEVYSEAIGIVFVEGSGSACANAKTTGTAEATAFSEILAAAIAAAENSVTKAKASTYVNQRITVFASAFAEAYATACIKGRGNAFAIQTVLARAIAKPIATLSIFLVADVDCSGYSGFAEAYVDGSNTSEDDVSVDSTSDTGVDGDGNADAGGGGTASTHEKCSGQHKLCCLNAYVGQKNCGCTARPNQPARCHGRRPKTDTGADWVIDGKKCKC